MVSGSRRILIVDDDPSVGTALRRALSSSHEVLVEERAIDALNRLERGELFDLILCDVHMPGLMGPDFYHWVRKVRPDHAPRIVLMTGANVDEATELLEGVGATLLSKPLSMRTLEAIVQSLGV